MGDVWLCVHKPLVLSFEFVILLVACHLPIPFFRTVRCVSPCHAAAKRGTGPTGWVQGEGVGQAQEEPGVICEMGWAVTLYIFGCSAHGSHGGLRVD